MWTIFYGGKGRGENKTTKNEVGDEHRIFFWMNCQAGPASLSLVPCPVKSSYQPSQRPPSSMVVTAAETKEMGLQDSIVGLEKDSRD